VIALLTGLVSEKRDSTAIVDVNGVGYLVHLSAVTLMALPPAGQRTTLRIYTSVREDAIQLFGFGSEEEEAVFRELISVSSIGPRAAQNILSGISARELAMAVAQKDLARLTKVPGVGKKTAERLMVELKEKLAPFARDAPAGAPTQAAALEHLQQALVGLGYRPQQAEQAVEAMRDSAEGRPLDELLREALKRLRG
jgi:Holliday junction DNA helicase RuvA